VHLIAILGSQRCVRMSAPLSTFLSASLMTSPIRCTFMAPATAESGLGVPEATLFGYLLGWVLAEASELLAADRMDAYLRDPFNFLDLLLVAFMSLTLLTRLLVALDLETRLAPGGSLGEARQLSTLETALDVAEVGLRQLALETALELGSLASSAMLPCQAVMAMLGWLRLLQVLYIFPRYGPLLIMAIRMLEDLTQFVILAVFVLISFGAAFFVLFNGHASLDGLATGTLAEPVSFREVLTMLMEGTLDGEPDRIMSMQSAHALSPFAWCLMALFGVVVVLLMLNLLIARFAKTFDLVHEDLAGTFQVAFARVAIKGAGLQAIPPPFNLIRGLVLALYAAAELAREIARTGCATWLTSVVSGSAFEALHDTDTDITAEQTASIFAFLKKATSPEVRLYPDAVEVWVRQHQFDFSQDQRWRTNMNKHIGAVEDKVDDVSQRVIEMQANLKLILDNQNALLAGQPASAPDRALRERL